MKHEELTWNASGLRIAAQVWEPDAPPKAVACLVHGHGEHSGRYEHVAAAFGAAGYAMFAADLRGHGHSAGSRGHVSSIEEFMRDIDELLTRARARYPGVPVFLYGHSLGGILVLHYCLRRKPNLTGVIVTSPALHSALEHQTVKVLAAKTLGALLPRLAVPSGLDASAISRDRDLVARYVNDPLVHDRMSMGFGKTMLGVTKWTLEHAADFPLPLLLMHGTSDPLAFPSSSEEFAAAAGSKVTLKLWDGGYHELHNDLEKASVLQTMTSWMDARLKGG